jgi:hypothetical protein
MARLYVGPQHTLLEVADRLRVSVTTGFLTVAHRDRRRVRPRSMGLARQRLVVARAVPTEDIALWFEERPGVVARVVGLRPLELLDESALAAWRRLDRLAGRLHAALVDDGRGARRAFELGRGQHRVLLVEHSDRMVLYARPLFRERPRRTLEVRADGTILVATRDADGTIHCNSRYAVTVLGDRIRFESSDGRDVATVWLPWISPEDRVELAARLGAFVHEDVELRGVAAG